MGNVTISTKDTEIYYPSDWLIEGGPPFETMHCPEFIENEDVQPLQVIYNAQTRFFGVTHNGFIVMESKEPSDLAKYIKQYMEAFQDWVTEQDEINAEAESDSE
jgi:hypothetical protein